MSISTDVATKVFIAESVDNIDGLSSANTFIASAKEPVSTNTEDASFTESRLTAMSIYSLNRWIEIKQKISVIN
ncbi:MAG: hypothetical protein M0Q95_15260 [Porticoccaceae bacterium]|nr:hypothetical protein [Porticoccaceae bacterium]